jgi:hypothetical protein
MSGNTCRFCKVYAYSGLIGYGSRHYAHPECFITKKGGAALSDLSISALNQIPQHVARDCGALADWHEAIAAHHLRESGLIRRTDENAKILGRTDAAGRQLLWDYKMRRHAGWRKSLSDDFMSGLLPSDLESVVVAIGFDEIDKLHDNACWPYRSTEATPC